MLDLRISDFTKLPGGRFIKDGDGSAEQFYKEKIQPHSTIITEEGLNLDFSGTWGYGPSFTSQLAIYLVSLLGKDIFDKLKYHATDDPEVIVRFENDIQKALADEK